MSLRQSDGRSPVLLHLHIPKTAGTALNDALVEIYREGEWTEEEDGWLVCGVYYTRAGIEHHFVPDGKTRSVFQRNDIRAIVGHFSFGLHEYIDGPCEYVTLLRHPVERVASLYHHILAWDNETIREEVVSRGLTLDQFVRDLRFIETDNGQTRRLAGAVRPFGQCGRDLLDRAKENLAQRFVVAGLTERFVESLVLMKRRLGWPSMPIAKKRNVNHSRPRGDMTLPPAVLAAVLERNQLDLELYAFAARKFEEQVAAETPDFWTDCGRLAQVAQKHHVAT